MSKLVKFSNAIVTDSFSCVTVSDLPCSETHGEERNAVGTGSKVQGGWR